MERSSSTGLVVFNCAAMFQHGIVLLAIGPLVPEIMADFRIDESTVGLLLAVGSLGFVSGPLLAGLLVDRFSVRAAFVVGSAVEILFCIVLGLSPAFSAAIIGFFFFKFGASFIETGANVMPTIVPTKRKAHALMNFIHFFFSIGAFVGPLVIGLYLGASGKWRPVFLALIVPTALLLLRAAFLRVPEREGVGSGGESRLGLGRVLSSRATLFGAIALMCYVGAEVGLSAWIVYYLRETLGLSAAAASAGLSVLWFCAMIGRYLNSVLGNRFSSALLVTVSGIGGAISGVLLIHASSVASAFLLLGASGLFLSGVFPNVMGEINGRHPGRAGAVTAIMSTGAAIGAALFQWVIGITAEELGLRAAFYIPAALQLVVVVAFYLALSGDRSAAAPLQR